MNSPAPNRITTPDQGVLCACGSNPSSFRRSQMLPEERRCLRPEAFHHQRVGLDHVRDARQRQHLKVAAGAEQGVRPASTCGGSTRCRPPCRERARVAASGSSPAATGSRRRKPPSIPAAGPCTVPCSACRSPPSRDAGAPATAALKTSGSRSTAFAAIYPPKDQPTMPTRSASISGNFLHSAFSPAT